MFPSVPIGLWIRDPSLDDIQGIHTLNAGHHRIPSPDSSNKSGSIVCDVNDNIWALGGQAVGNGFRIYRFNDLGGGNGSWSQHPFGGEATMLAASGYRLWHINKLGEMYRESASGSWERIDGEASFIAASQSEVWHLSKGVTRGPKDRDLYRWSGSGWNRVTGKAADIALTTNPVNDKIEVWYTTEAGRVYRQNVGESATLMPAVPNGACGISTGTDGSVFVQACPSSNGVALFVYNSQKAIDNPGGDSDAPFRNQWTQVAYTSAKDATANSFGTIFHVGTDGLYASD
jgi:hypothetical protein